MGGGRGEEWANNWIPLLFLTTIFLPHPLANPVTILPNQYQTLLLFYLFDRSFKASLLNYNIVAFKQWYQIYNFYLLPIHIWLALSSFIYYIDPPSTPTPPSLSIHYLSSTFCLCIDATWVSTEINFHLNLFLSCPLYRNEILPYDPPLTPWNPWIFSPPLSSSILPYGTVRNPYSRTKAHSRI